MKNLPAAAKDFLKNPDAPEARASVRLFLPPSPEGLFLTFVAFLFCGIFAFGLWATMIAVLKKEAIEGNKGALGVMLGFAALFTWATIYAFGGLRVRVVRVGHRRPQFGYWILQSGILARNRVREIIYLPWEKITAITEVKLYQKSSESPYYSVYPTLRVGIKDNHGIMHYNFSGASEDSVLKEKISSSLVNLYRYDISGKNAGEFRMFRTACSEFKPLQKGDA